MRFEHMDWQPDLAALVGEAAIDRVTDPPRTVGREAKALAVIEAIDGLHQADVALLDQVLERHVAVVETPSNRDDEAEVGLDERVLRVAESLPGVLDPPEIDR